MSDLDDGHRLVLGQRQRRVEHVGGGQAVVDPAPGGAGGGRQDVDEGRGVVIGDALALLGGRALEAKPPAEQLRGLTGPAGEQVHPGKREVYVYYPEGMGRSKLKLPLGGASATVRNINTVAKLIALAEG